MSNKPVKSLGELVKRHLHVGSWDSEATAIVKRWWKRNKMQARRSGRIAKTERAFSAMVEERLDERDRIVLGHWLAVFARQHFDAGLTAGLCVRLNDEEKT